MEGIRPPLAGSWASSSPCLFFWGWVGCPQGCGGLQHTPQRFPPAQAGTRSPSTSCSLGLGGVAACAGWVRGRESRKLLLGSASQAGTESYRKGPRRGGFRCCLVGLVPCTTHQRSQGCSRRGCSPVFIRTRGHQTPGGSFPISSQPTSEQKRRRETSTGRQPSLTSPDTLATMLQKCVSQGK